MFKKPRVQIKQDLDLKLYKHRVVVNGTRGYRNKVEFHNELIDFIDSLEGDIIFISGQASSGADKMIIDWCKKYNYPCIKMPANWDQEGSSAGYKRNLRMLEVATALLSFYDGKSNGTGHTLHNARENGILTREILVNVQ